MIVALLSSIVVATNSVTFTAHATGIEKTTPVEFFLAAAESDRDYETMFLLDDKIEDLIRAIRAAGIPDGVSTDPKTCTLWPVGVPVEITPPMSDYIESDPVHPGETYPCFIYTGGKKNEKGESDAAVNMPMAFHALYDCAQSPIQYDAIFPQGLVYGKHTARISLKKGESRTFTLKWDGKTRPQMIDLTLKPGSLAADLRRLKDLSSTRQLVVRAIFDDSLKLVEAIADARALETIDSKRIKVNANSDGGFFYRAFLPLVKWRDRKERLVQPFEIKHDAKPTLTYIHEDWSGPGDDPVLTPKQIAFSDSARYEKTDTAFIFAKGDTTIGALKAYRKLLPKTVINWYIYPEQQ